jgi:hypothetical protein
MLKSIFRLFYQITVFFQFVARVLTVKLASIKFYQSSGINTQFLTDRVSQELHCRSGPSVPLPSGSELPLATAPLRKVAAWWRGTSCRIRCTLGQPASTAALR